LTTIDTTGTADAASVILEEPPPPRLSFTRVLIAMSEPRAVRSPRQAPPASAVPALPLSDWKRVLYVGSVDGGQHAAPHPSKPTAEEPRAFTAWTDGRAAAMRRLEDERSDAAGEMTARPERYRTAGSVGLGAWRFELRRTDRDESEPRR
jgi:hypothetical protein